MERSKDFQTPVKTPFKNLPDRKPRVSIQSPIKLKRDKRPSWMQDKTSTESKVDETKEPTNLNKEDETIEPSKENVEKEKIQTPSESYQTPDFVVVSDYPDPESENEEYSDTESDEEDYHNILITESSKDLAAFQVYIHSQPEIILVDPCASISVMNEAFWNRVSKGQGRVKAYHGTGIRVGDSRMQQILGTGTFTFMIKDKKFKVEAVIIKNWMHDILLSVQWLRDHQAIINLENNTLTLCNIPIKLLIRGVNNNWINLLDQNQELSKNYLVSMEEIKIPKRSTTWIKIKPTLPTIPGSHWIENEDIGLDRDVRLTRGPINLRRLDHDLLAMVKNHTFEEVIININQPLGTLYKNPVLDSSDPQFHNLKKKYHQNDYETNS